MITFGPWTKSNAIYIVALVLHVWNLGFAIPRSDFSLATSIALPRNNLYGRSPLGVPDNSLLLFACEAGRDQQAVV
jgi:hypothetical protein